MMVDPDDQDNVEIEENSSSTSEKLSLECEAKETEVNEKPVVRGSLIEEYMTS